MLDNYFYALLGGSDDILYLVNEGYLAHFTCAIECAVGIVLKVMPDFQTTIFMLVLTPFKTIFIYVMSDIFETVLSEKLTVDRNTLDVIAPNTVRELPLFPNDLK